MISSMFTAVLSLEIVDDEWAVVGLWTSRMLEMKAIVINTAILRKGLASCQLSVG